MAADTSPGEAEPDESAIGDAILADAFAEFQCHGAAAIVRLRTNSPEQYFRLVGAVMRMQRRAAGLGCLH